MTIDMKSLAREGAKARLWQLETEKNRTTPGISGSARRRSHSSDFARRHRRGRRQMTAAERRSVSVRMKRYWAERRQKNGVTQAWPWSSEGDPASAKASPPRAERRLLLPRRNAGRRFGNRARPRQRPRAGAPSATGKQARSRSAIWGRFADHRYITHLMTRSTTDQRLVSARFPRSSAYHPDWVMGSASGGANALWLTEWLADGLELKPGLRVLDLGCGRATRRSSSSVSLA